MTLHSSNYAFLCYVLLTDVLVIW